MFFSYGAMSEHHGVVSHCMTIEVETYYFKTVCTNRKPNTFGKHVQPPHVSSGNDHSVYHLWISFNHSLNIFVHFTIPAPFSTHFHSPGGGMVENWPQSAGFYLVSRPRFWIWSPWKVAYIHRSGLAQVLQHPPEKQIVATRCFLIVIFSWVTCRSKHTLWLE